MEVIRGGTMLVSAGGMPAPPVLVVDEYAECCGIPCDFSRHDISSAICDATSGFPDLCASRRRLCKYCMEISGSRNAAFIMQRRTGALAAVRAAASCGLVDQTNDEAVGERGRKAMGPVGKKRWYAVVLAGSNSPRGG
jgi:hypothetical protein